MRARSILRDTFEVRIEAVEALLAVQDARAQGAPRLRAAAEAMERISCEYEYTPSGGDYAAFGELLRGVALLVEWRAAVLTAEPDADRFLHAAKERHRLWREEQARNTKAGWAINAMRAAVETLPDLDAVSDVATIIRSVTATPLPIGVFEAEHRPRIPGGLRRRDEEPPKPQPPEDLAVAFVKFTLDGQPAAETHFLTPDQVHDLNIEVRVNRWPLGAETLELRPISIEAAGTFELPTFNVSKPSGEAPYVMRAQGRAVIKVAQSLHARPFEFKYTAQFTPQATEQPVAVVGQRTLRIEGVDLQRDSFTGYGNLDRKVVELRDQLRAHRWMTPEDLADVLAVLKALANFAGRAVQGNVVTEVWPEARFQREIREDLRRRPNIGARLEEHPNVAGGEVDLSFGGVRIELKSVHDRRYLLADCEAFVDQTVSYAVASGKRVGVLCVLDCSPKDSPPFPTDEGLGVLQRATAGPPVCIVTVLIQGNLARPSQHSRAARGRKKPAPSGRPTPL